MQYVSFKLNVTLSTYLLLNQSFNELKKPLVFPINILHGIFFYVIL